MMYTVLMNLEEYILFIQDKNNSSVIQSEEEALLILEDIFSKLDRLNTDKGQDNDELT